MRLYALPFNPYVNTILLAKELGVDTVVNFAGCPGESEHSLRSVWVTCPWPTDFLDTLTWQWVQKVIPYWEKMGQYARDNGIRIAVEPHPGYSTACWIRSLTRMSLIVRGRFVRLDMVMDRSYGRKCSAHYAL
nr:TIM barrel protein [Paenibacillus periandrae]